MLSAISRLNPHVDLKKIVIGLMDRLSSYATKESKEDESPEVRQKAEEEATVALLEKVRLSKEKEVPLPSYPKEDTSESKQNGETQEEETKAEDKEPETDEATTTPAKEEPETESKDTKGDESQPTPPEDIKLYEIFYEQVVNLVKTRGLPIQDTIALLVSLANLAL